MLSVVPAAGYSVPVVDDDRHPFTAVVDLVDQ